MDGAVRLNRESRASSKLGGRRILCENAGHFRQRHPAGFQRLQDIVRRKPLF